MNDFSDEPILTIGYIILQAHCGHEGLPWYFPFGWRYILAVCQLNALISSSIYFNGEEGEVGHLIR
jgi:hypothetical protein